MLMPIYTAQTNAKNARNAEIARDFAICFSSLMAHTRWKYSWLVTPPGSTENTHSSTVPAPSLLMEPLIDSIAGSIFALILLQPPPMFVTSTIQTMHMKIMKQAKIKSVHATVFRPAGITNSRLTITKIIQSIV